jgi:hypothetical protein
MKRTLGILLLLGAVNLTLHAQSKNDPQGQGQIKVSQSITLAPAAGFRRVQQKTIGLTELVQEQNGKQVSRVSITTELRTDHAEALQRLLQIANEAGGKRTFTQVCGWPALQRMYRIRLAHVQSDMEQAGKQSAAAEVDVDAVTIAVAAADEIVRLEGVLEPGAPVDVTTQILALSHSISCPANPNPQETQPAIDKLNQDLRSAPAGLGLGLAGGPPMRGAQRAAESKVGVHPLAAQVQPGFGELQIAVSSNGQNVVIGANSGISFSNDFGGQFAASNVAIPFGNRGDTTVGWGPSGTFYLGLIGFPAVGGVSTCADSVFASKDNGQNFNFVGNAAACLLAGPNASPCLPDQPQMAVDGTNLAGGQDQLYMVWRNFPLSGTFANCNAAIQSSSTGNPAPTIACSQDGGKTWTQRSVGTGDRRRVTVGSDGSVYGTYVSTLGEPIVTLPVLLLTKFNSCANGLQPQRGFPVPVAFFQGVTCPIPGLDRCTSDSESSPQPAAAGDDVYVAYAAAAGNGNDNIVVQHSHDAAKHGRTLRSPTATLRRDVSFPGSAPGILIRST